MKNCFVFRKGERFSFRKALLFFFFPPKCALCKQIGYEPLCPNCENLLEKAFSPKKILCRGGNGFADEMFRLFPYQNSPVAGLLLDWKHQDFEDLHQIFSSYLARTHKMKLLPQEIDFITFCPRRNSARKKAGFDQAEKIAEIVSDIFQIPMLPLLKRRGFSAPQHKTKGEKRIQNVKNVFSPTKELQGEVILLIDDIVTTGASVKEASRVLKKAGAMKVYVLSLAHSEKKKPS